MTAAVVSLPRGGAGARAPLVPPGVDLQEDEIFLRLPAWIFDSEWAIECTRDERLAGITLRTRALKQVGNAGSLPASDRLLARLADYGDDVRGWEAVKAKALEGWIPCSDGRWHHPEIARNVLHIWIGRLESRRISAWGNKGRVKKGNGRSLDSIMDDMDAALDALAAIDPQDAVLGRGADQQAKWRERIAAAAEGIGDQASAGTETPYEGPNRSPNRPPPEGDLKVRQAKRSQGNNSSPLCGDDSRIEQNEPAREIEIAACSVERTLGGIPLWPTDWLAKFKALYPRKKSWGAAEKVLQRLRKAGTVAFEAIMAGVERLVAAGGDPQFVPYPATWLAARGWEDEADPPARGASDPRGRATAGRPSAIAGIRRRLQPPPPREGDDP